jgi:hypothetical protein
MFIDIDGNRLQLDLKLMETKFPEYKHLFTKPLRFMLHPSLFKPDPDNPGKFMVRRRHGIKTKANIVDPLTGATSIMTYFESSNPDKHNPQITRMMPKFLFLEYGEKIVDIRKGGGRVNLAMAYYLLSHPQFNNEYYLEDLNANARKQLLKDTATFEAMRFLFDKKFDKYISDDNIESVAKSFGIEGMQGKDPSIIRTALVEKVNANPALFEKFEGSKSGRVMSLITEASDYKIITYNVTKKQWWLTKYMEVKSPMASREIDREIFKASSANAAKDELVKFLIEVDTSNLEAEIESLLNSEKLRVDSIASEFQMTHEDVITQIQIQKKVTV